MRLKEFKELIEKGESTTLEFKRKATTAQKFAKEISAMANTKGGVLLVGVDDDGTIVGVESEKYEVDIIVEACQFWINPPIEPNIEIFNLHGKEIVILHIEPGPLKPYMLILENKESGNSTKKAYIRMGEKSVLASREMYRLMKEQRPESHPLKISIGDMEKRLFTYLEKQDKITVKEYAKLVNISARRATRLLIQLVRAGVIQIHNDSHNDYFTLV
jgi:predicted HTH transcriptional regulator